MLRRSRQETPRDDLGRLAHPAHYQLRYSLVAHQTHVLLVEEAREAARIMLPDLAESAPKRAHELLVDAGTALQHDVDRPLAAFLWHTVEPSAALLLAGLRLIVGRQHDASDAVAQRVMRDRGEASAFAKADDDIRPIDELRAAIAEDPDAGFVLLLPFALHPERRITPRAHYTAACFFSTVAMGGDDAGKRSGTALDLALHHLAIALAGSTGAEGRTRASGVKSDPSLAALVENQSRKAALDALLAEFADAPPAPKRDSFDED